MAKEDPGALISDQAPKISSVSRFNSPPTAAEIDRQHQLELHRDICHKIQEDVEDAFPNDGKTRYTNVHVLLICWANEEPNLPVSLELDELEFVFSRHYGYTTEKWRIPEENCHNELSRKVMDFIDLGGDSRRHLKIVYYGGHGMLTKGRQPLWYNLPDRTSRAYRQLKWSGIQNNLEEAQSDVLILLDCCASGTANTDTGQGTTELIAACGFDAIANYVGSHSFTQALIRELKDLSREPSFTVSMLYNNILSRLSKWMSEGPGAQKRSPLYVPLTQNTHLPRPIQLSPEISRFPPQRASLVSESNSSTCPGDPMKDRLGIPLGTLSSSAINLCLHPELTRLPQIVVNVWIQEQVRLGDIEVETFADWVRMVPILAERVQIDTGAVDYCRLLKFLQVNFLGDLHQNGLESLPAMRNQISLTQETLRAADAVLDKFVEQGRQARASFGTLERTVSQRFADVAHEIKEQGDKAAESAKSLNQILESGFTSLASEMTRQGKGAVASSDHISNTIEIGLEATNSRLDEINKQTEEIRKQTEESMRRNTMLLDRVMKAITQLSSPAGMVSRGRFAPDEAFSKTGLRTKDVFFGYRFEIETHSGGGRANNTIRIRPPRRTSLLTLGLSKTLGTFVRFPSRIIVSRQSSLFKACRKFEILAVQQLFQAELASLYDRAYDKSYKVYISPIEETISSIFQAASYEDISHGLVLLKFLTQCGSGDSRLICAERMADFIRLHQKMQKQLSAQQIEGLAECVRQVLQYSDLNPLDYTAAAAFITLDNKASPVFRLLALEEFWPLKWDEIPYNTNNLFGETDHAMLRDPRGDRMYVAVTTGREYIAFNPGFIFGRKLRCISALHSLLLQVNISKRDDIEECCQRRLTTLLCHGTNPRASDWVLDDFGRRKIELTPTGYALDLGIIDLWKRALEGACWTETKIGSLFDEEMYAGVPELVSGSLSYLSREDCRKEFVSGLQAGVFVGLSDKDLDRERKTLQLNLGASSSRSVLETIQQASRAHSVLSAKKAPGGWVDDDSDGSEDNRVRPGVDFELPARSVEGDLIDWWQYFDEAEGDEGEDCWYDAPSYGFELGPGRGEYCDV